MKQCSRCGEAKPAEQFRKDRLRCLRCTREVQRMSIAEKMRSPYAVDRERSSALPIGPLRNFLRERLPRYETLDAMAEAMGTSERTIRRMLNAAETVHLDTVDRILTAEGSTPLAVLYPEELYPSEEAA